MTALRTTQRCHTLCAKWIGEAKIDRNRAGNRLQIRLGNLTYHPADSLHANGLDMIDHRL